MLHLVRYRPRQRIASRSGALLRFAGIFLLPCANAAEPSWFDDVERYTPLREIRLDVAGPESASFTALGVAPFVTAQALSGSGITLGKYQRSHPERIASRLQLSLAVSRGESAQNRSTRIAPTLRIVFHEQRDPRVHRGPGSLKDCFERRVTPPETPPAAQRGQPDVEERYRAALQETVRQDMELCQDDPEVAAYTWNATGIALGISPSLRNDADDLGSLNRKGLVVFVTGSFGFDRRGTRPTYIPSFLGSHAQVLAQVLYRHNEPLQDPQRPGSFTNADELIASLRLRGGTSRLNANLEAALIRDSFRGQQNDVLTRLSLGVDSHLARGTWLSLSVGRAFWRNAIPERTSAGLSIKFTPLH